MKVIGLTEAWWVWLGEEPAIRVASEEAAVNALIASGREYGIENSYGRSDMACPVAEILWDKPLPEGKRFHKTVFSPLTMVLHKGVVRKCIGRISPSKLAKLSKGWDQLEPKFPSWFPRQYNEALNNPDVFVLQGVRPFLDQLNEKYVG